MQIQYLYSFCAIVELGSFSKAAEKLRCSQAAVSKQIRTVEEELGCQLFTRKGKRISLNSNGEVVYRHSRKVLADLADMRRELFVSVRQPGAVLRVVGTDEMGLLLLPAWLEAFKETHADCCVQVMMDRPEFVLRMVKEMQIHIGLRSAGDALQDEELVVAPVQVPAAVLDAAKVAATAVPQLVLVRHRDALLSTIEQALWDFMTAKV